MTPEEVEAAARLGGRAAAGIATHVGEIHRGVAARAFGAVGVPAAPARYLHDGVARVVYGSVTTALRGAGVAAGAALRTITPAEAPTARQRPEANQALAALNAVLGADLAARGDPLAIEMALRHLGRDVPVTPGALAAVFPDATTSIAVFLHGLGENENAWRLRAGEGGVTYGSRLAADAGFTPLYVRYNTGRHISDNGAEFARLLESIAEAWPVGVDRIVLVGHSMGGLVARSACHRAEAEGLRWPELTSDVVYLGSPHGGARLARSARVLAAALSKLPETQAWAAPLDASPGIRDLRHGYLTPEDWAACDDGSCLENHGVEIPLLATANHYTVSATVVADPRTPAGRVVGDLLVQPSSAHGRRRNGNHLPFLDRVNVPGRHHFSLLNDPDVYQAIRRWIQVGLPPSPPFSEIPPP